MACSLLLFPDKTSFVYELSPSIAPAPLSAALARVSVRVSAQTVYRVRARLHSYTGDSVSSSVAMSGMRAHLANRLRSSSLSAVPPPRQSSDYSVDLAKAAASILYRSPIPSKEGRPVFVLNAAALPDTHDTDFDQLLPYVLARLPEEDDLLKGYEYEVVFFAGDGDGSATSKKHRPGWGWFLQAYHVLSRAMRKRLQRLYIVHEKAWVRILTDIFSTIVSPKFRRKIYHGMARTLHDRGVD